ncbi:glycosyl hydrolase family 18 protein [Amycolatopsis sp. NPDC051071]|uniref:glycosyl hydrolase family 18 protein n=1 Tax=Amycolatopsis sp. NPDC051071 TaxID=3154637 RepID=UPI003422B3CD
MTNGGCALGDAEAATSGWTWSGGFGEVAKNPAKFAESCYNLVNDPRWVGVFDGIDIDWEYANACGLSCGTSGAAAIKELARALRTKFGSKLVTDLRLLRRMAPQGPTAPHSPLNDYAGIPTAGFHSDAAIQKLKSKGVPASKLLLGIGFYGRGWTGVTQDAPGGTATGAAQGTYEADIEDYDTPATIGGKVATPRTRVSAAPSSGSGPVTPPTAS